MTSISLLLGAFIVTPAISHPSDVPPVAVWGGHGHAIAARAAVRTLPSGMPEFFLAAEEQLVYLNPEPDRWRDRVEAGMDPAMGESFAPDHWLHMDEVPVEFLHLDNRFDYAIALDRAGLNPEEVGMLHFRLVEMAQRLRSNFRRWRVETDPNARRYLEDRIINDAGILGHYVTDASNPHHTSMHHDRWIGENPRGFTEAMGFHGRFEGQFVAAKVTFEDILAASRGDATVFPSIRLASWNHLQGSHDRLIRLYELDRVRPFGSDNDSPEHKAFAVERLSSGAVMLRNIWWTAWVTSAEAL